jgi:hypothetical protein
MRHQYPPAQCKSPFPHADREALARLAGLSSAVNDQNVFLLQRVKKVLDVLIVARVDLFRSFFDGRKYHRSIHYITGSRCTAEFSSSLSHRIKEAHLYSLESNC